MESNIGIKLSEENWFAYNTLVFVLQWLKPQDILRCCQVCKLWQEIVMEPATWRSVTLNGCNIHLDQMSNALRDLGSSHLKINECAFFDNDFDLFGALKKMPSLRKLELSECSSKLLEKLPEANSNLEVVKANIIGGMTSLSLNFLSQMANVTNLKLYCNRELENPLQPLHYLKNLEHLYLLGVKNLDNLNLQECNLSQCGKLATLGLGNCWKLPKTFGNDVLRPLTSLKKLRLESCMECNLVYILESISHLNSLECLELVVINIDNGFERSLKLCTNIKKLTIVPNPRRLKMALYNCKIAAGVTSLKHTLKDFTWSFPPGYLEYTHKISEQKDCVPIIPSFSSSDKPLVELTHWLEPSFVNLADLEEMISNEMISTNVKVNCKEYTGNIFLPEI